MDELAKFSELFQISVDELMNGKATEMPVQMFARSFGELDEADQRDRRPGDIATCYSDPSKAWTELGWKAEYSIEEMCRDSWNWQRKNPEGYR